MTIAADNVDHDTVLDPENYNIVSGIYLPHLHATDVHRITNGESRMFCAGDSNNTPWGSYTSSAHDGDHLTVDEELFHAGENLVGDRDLFVLPYRHADSYLDGVICIQFGMDTHLDLFAFCLLDQTTAQIVRSHLNQFQQEHRFTAFINGKQFTLHSLLGEETLQRLERCLAIHNGTRAL